MFDYNICTVADRELFYKQCKAIEEHIPNLNAKELLEDVDGTLIKEYMHPKGKIIVKNDEPVGALYVRSDFDLSPCFRDIGF